MRGADDPAIEHGPRERALRELTQALAVNLDERHVLDLAVEHGARLLEAPYARIWLLEPDGELRCAAAEGYVGAATFTERLARDSISGRAAHEARLNVANAPAATGWHFNREFGRETGLGAYLGAGLWRAGGSLGVIEVMRELGRAFTVAEEATLASLANAVAVAVSNARTHAALATMAHEAEERAAALAESERLLRSIYAAIGSGVLVFDAVSRVIAANAAAEEILGRPAARLLGMTSADFGPGTHPAGGAISLEDRPVQRAIRTLQAVRKSVFGLTRPDGSQRWIEVDAVPLFDADNQVTQVVSSFVDITERRQSEAALQARDAILEAVAFGAERLLRTADWQQEVEVVLARLGAATGVSRVFISGADQNGERVFHEWVAAGEPALERGPAALPDIATLGLAPWESGLRAGTPIQTVAETPRETESRTLASDAVLSRVAVPVFEGTTWWGVLGLDDCRTPRTWASAAIEVLKTAAGTLGAAIGRRRSEAERLQLVREQAARAEAEAAQRRLAFLAEASQLLAASLDYATTLESVASLAIPFLADACVVHLRQPDGQIRRVAAAGVTLVEAGESSIEPNSEHPIAQAMRTGAPALLVDVPLELRPDADPPAASAMVVPLVVRGVVFGSITYIGSGARRPFEPAELEVLDHLARRCAIAIDNASLYRDAREAIGTRDEFLSVAAHELKTPMTSLRGYAQLLGREFQPGGTPDPERARRASRTIEVQANKLARLVAQLLDISRIQSGRLVVERVPTDASELLREVVESARPQLRAHDLVARLSPTGPVLLDPLRIEQVLTNLIDNAIKYSPEGGQIDITLRAVGDGQHVQLGVRDRGVGVAPEHRPHIFDRFYQAHAGGALTSMAGLGLGLYISRQIVELHGGTIEADFPSDGGTHIIVTLPCN